MTSPASTTVALLEDVEENDNEASTTKLTANCSNPWPYLSCYFDYKSRNIIHQNIFVSFASQNVLKFRLTKISHLISKSIKRLVEYLADI